MALCDSDRCAWSSCSLVDAVPAPTLNGISNGGRSTGGDGVKVRKEDSDGVKVPKEEAFNGVKNTASGHSEAKKLNGHSVPLPFHPKPRSCILGMGTATPDRVFLMSEFAKTILHGYGVDTPEVREFSARICKNHEHPAPSGLPDTIKLVLTF